MNYVYYYLQSLGPVLRSVKKMKSLSIRDELVEGVSHELIFEMMCEYGTIYLTYDDGVFQ